MSFDSRNMIEYFRKQTGSNHVSGEYSTLDDLMNFHDGLFVQASFRALLQREVDPVGLNYYVLRLRRGFSRISVLNQLVNSREIRPDWHLVVGLKPAIDRYRGSRKIGGWRLALFDPDIGNTPSLRRARALQNSLGSQQQILISVMEKIENSDYHSYDDRRDGSGSLKSEKKDGGIASVYLAPNPRSISSIRKIDLPDQIQSAVSLLSI